MFRWIAKRKMAAFEREFDYRMDYARELLDASPRGFFWFSFLSAIAGHREGAPLDAWFAAKLTATLSEDCGPCTQLVVTMAERAGVSAGTLRAILVGEEAEMPADAALGYRFAKATLARDQEEGDRLRKEVLSRWGKKALVSLALTIASSRTFPSIKYALGYGRACSRVRVAGSDLVPASVAKHW